MSCYSNLPIGSFTQHEGNAHQSVCSNLIDNVTCNIRTSKIKINSYSTAEETDWEMVAKCLL